MFIIIQFFYEVKMFKTSGACGVNEEKLSTYNHESYRTCNN